MKRRNESGNYTNEEITEFSGMAMGFDSNNGGFMNEMSSMSSQSSSNGPSKSDTDIRFVEEGIDYDRTPKPLLYLKIAMAFLFLSLIILASVQFGQSQLYEQENLKCQELLFKTISNQQYLKELMLMARTYVNINLGLEPRDGVIGDRRSKLR